MNRSLSIKVAVATSLLAALGMTGCGVSPAYRNALTQTQASLNLIEEDYSGYVNADPALSDVDRSSRLLHLESTQALIEATLNPSQPTP